MPSLCIFGERWDDRGLAGGENVPELFGWLSVSTGFITTSDGCSFSDREGRQITRCCRTSGGGSKFRSYAPTTFSRLVNCILIRFLSTPEERPLYEHKFDYLNAEKSLRHSRFCVRGFP